MSFEGKQHSEETKAKMRAAWARKKAAGKTISPETRAKMGEAQKRRWEANPEFRQQMSEAVSAMWADPERREAACERMQQRAKPTEEMRQANRERMQALWEDPEYRERVRAAREAAKKPRSKEYCEAISERNRARAGKVKWSAEAKARHSERMKAQGRKHSPDTKAKMSAARIKYLQTAGFEVMGHQPTRWGMIPYRSTWEQASIVHLEAQESVESLEYEALTIPYSFGGVSKLYVPDFRITTTTGKVFLLEVKPKKFLKSDAQTQAKVSAALKFCDERGWGFVTISEAELAGEFPLFE